MSLSLVDVAGANFRTDETSDEMNTQFMSRMGVKVRYLPARLAIARSLAVGVNPPGDAPEQEQGKSIKGDTLFGTGGAMAAWTSLIVERAASQEIDLKTLQELVSAHWRRGMLLLREDWDASENDPARFVQRLMAAADLRPEAARGDGARPKPEYLIASPLVVPIGEISKDAVSRDTVEWALNASGGSPHSAIMGGVGSGKTRTAVAMLKSLRQQCDVPLLVFDFKGDLGEPKNPSFTYGLDRMFGGVTVRPPEITVPLDVLHIPDRTEIEIGFAAQRFQESFANLKGSKVGVIQKQSLYEAAVRSFRNKTPCHLRDILSALRAVYAEKGLDEDGAVATMDAICRFPLFEPTQRPVEFFSRSWVISLPAQLPEESRGIIVNLLLDALDSYLNSAPEAPTDGQGNRALRIMCVVDEAHRILGTKLPGLSSLIRQSRSKGGAIMLISQSPDDFSGEDDDFLNEMGLVVAFSTNAKPASAGRVLGKGINLSALGSGECLVKRRGDSSARRIISWQKKTA